jgi:hypothetical protein
VEGLDVHVPRGADRSPIDVHGKRHLGLAAERLVEPAVEAERVHARVAVDLRLTLGCLAQAFAVTLGDRLDAHDPSCQWCVWSKS